MTTPLIVKNSISIKAPIEKVWDALTNPSQTRKYMFGCEALSDWKPGSPLLWQGIYEGSNMVFVKGHILAIQPPYLLRYTVIDPNGTIEDKPENYLNVNYELSSVDGSTNLEVTQGDFATVDQGQKRFEEASNGGEGWNPILVQIKKIAEET